MTVGKNRAFSQTRSMCADNDRWDHDRRGACSVDELRHAHERVMMRLEDREGELRRGMRELDGACEFVHAAMSGVAASDELAFPQGNKLAQEMRDTLQETAGSLVAEAREARERMEHELRSVRQHMDEEDKRYARTLLDADEEG